VEFYLDILCFPLGSVGLNIAECVVMNMMLLYYCWNLEDTLSRELVLVVLFSQSPT